MAAITHSNDGKKMAADEELPDDAEGADESKPSPEPERAQPEGRPSPAKAKPAAPGFFTIQKKGQGYWTRMGTAIGAGGIGLMIAFELYYKIPTFLPGVDEAAQKRDKQIALAIALVFLAAYTLWGFWYTNKPGTVDFLIATDSEMKKVNWTTRKELIGSTKIVILFMFLIAIYLFACDLLFGGFFHLINVLKTWF
jgi:preprotein translocase subunit SecE